MSREIRPEISKRNQYWIDKHRYYELKHFCLQYPVWRRSYDTIDGLSRWNTGFDVYSKLNIPCDTTGKCVELRALYFDKMSMVEQTAIETDPVLAKYVFKAVTEGLSYDQLKARLGIPCSRGTYYDRYRRFFWLLNKRKNYIREEV